MKQAGAARSVLIIDDDRLFLDDLSALLAGRYRCRSVMSGEEALGAIASDPPDVAILDLVFERQRRDGMEILAQIRRLVPTLPVIMASSHYSEDRAAAAIAGGAIYFIDKRVGLHEISALLERCAEIGLKLRDRERILREVYPVFLATSAAMQALSLKIDQVAAAPKTSVLLTGENGTGKSTIAREIHRRSRNSQAPFISVNVANLSESLGESRLFGHCMGAFTGAVSDHRGSFEEAGDGTLFLDQMESLPLPVQGHLLRALEERVFSRIGETQERRFEGRVVIATTRDLGGLVREGKFRDDLLGRISTVTLRVPPLRERRDDIPDLARYYLGRYSAEMRIPRVEITEAALERLKAHPWKNHNLRELRNAVERALIFHSAAGALGPSDFELCESADGPDTGWSYADGKKQAVETWQRRFLETAFREVGGALQHPNSVTVPRVAELIGITPKGVRDVLRDLGIWPIE